MYCYISKYIVLNIQKCVSRNSQLVVKASTTYVDIYFRI